MDKDIISAAHDLQLGEEKLVRLVRKMDPDLGTIAQIIVKKAWPEPEPNKMVEPKHLNFSDTDSLIEYLKKWGDLETDIIFYSEDEAIYVRDIRAEFLPNGKHEQAVLAFQTSREFDRWFDVVDSLKAFDHKALLKWLRMNQDDIIDYAPLAESWSAIETTVGLKRDSSIDDANGRRVGVEFTSKTGKKTPGLLIDRFRIKVPVLHNDDPAVFELAIDIEEPSNADSPAYFYLRSRTLVDAKLRAVQEEIELMKSELEGWQILFGWPN